MRLNKNSLGKKNYNLTGVHNPIHKFDMLAQVTRFIVWRVHPLTEYCF
jgi:hypothetical protein